MAEIKVYNTAVARQEESFGFHKLAVAEMSKCTDEKFVPAYQAYETAYEAFDEALKQSGGEHVLSKPIEAQDDICDKLYRGLNSQVATMETFYDPDIAEVAREARVILKKYGNPTGLPYLEEAGVLHNLIQELEAFDGVSDSGSPDELSLLSTDVKRIASNRLAALHIDGWVSQLKAETARFLELFAERNTQKSSVVTGATKAARKATDEAYRSAAKRLNALAEVNGDADYIHVINALNVLIDRQNAIIKARATRNANKRKEEEEEG
ncbi:DUF6261 family protein [Parabacteroides sp. ZJ-118]|uniref:DUF6261 family protein n=1 Tax=Parabacteroides sp. ZJ-118 TaxID=2709398 RepID=UPI0013EBE119|nr:DUF6261 family protein [Parabacteroides sp. ZJ-118]